MGAQINTAQEEQVEILTGCFSVLNNLVFEPGVTVALIDLGLVRELSAFYLSHFISKVSEDEPGHLNSDTARLSKHEQRLLVEALHLTANVVADKEARSKVDFLIEIGLHHELLLLFKCYSRCLDDECFEKMFWCMKTLS